jgi:hypothetical protein
MAIKVSGTTVIDDNRNANVGIATFTGLNVPPVPITFSPAIGATGIATNSNIIITFDQQLSKGTGNITLRANSAGGTVLQTIAVSSEEVTISGGAVTINPPVNITGLGLTTFVVVDAAAFSGLTTTSVNNTINTYSFITTATAAAVAIPGALGSSFEGGYVICKASSLAWIVSPYSAEVSRTWASRNDANTRALAVTGSNGWFVPTCGQLLNPGYLCRAFWGPSPCYSTAFRGRMNTYWTSTEFNGTDAFFLLDWDPYGAYMYRSSKSYSYCVRSFRCVTY